MKQFEEHHRNGGNEKKWGRLMTCRCMDWRSSRFIRMYSNPRRVAVASRAPPSTITGAISKTKSVRTLADLIEYSFGSRRPTPFGLHSIEIEMGKLLLFLLALLLSASECCLVVQSSLIEMGNCPCPQIRYIDQDGIRANTYGSYLADRKVYWNGVSVSDSCTITVDAFQFGILNYYFMIFRDNFPPIFAKRFTFMNLPADYYTLDGLTCDFVDNQWLWHYYGGVVSNMTFAVQENQGGTLGCDCSDFPDSSPIYTAACDIFNVSCPNATNQPYWFSTNMAYNLLLPNLGNDEVDDATCVFGTWYYNGMKLEDVSLTCMDPVSIIDMHTPMENSYPCACRNILQITTANKYMNVYDMNGDFANYTIDDATVKYTDCVASIVCPSSDYVVFWGRNFGPMKYAPEKQPHITCQQTPLFLDASNLVVNNTAAKFWFVDGVMLSEPAVACISKTTTEPIDMNGCHCPQIEYIDQAGIQSLEYGSYLSDRTLLSPASVSVTDTCNVTVDPGNSENFYFMIFRDGAPPIFNRRFLPASTASPFHPIGLECSQINGSYEWTYFGGVVNNMSFALQSDDQMCSCGAIASSSQVHPGVCDILQVSCPTSSNQLYWFSLNMAYNLVLPSIGEDVVDDVTCVSGTWYYNGMALEDVSLTCLDPVSIVDMQPTTYSFSCGCRHMLAITSENRYMNVYDMNGDFSKFSIDTPSVTYPSDCSSPAISCPDSDYVVFFGRNFGPMQYTPDKLPAITCQPTPLSLNPETSGTFWFVDGVMLSEAAFVCLTAPPPPIEMNECKCPQIQYINQAAILNLKYGAYLANRTTFYPASVTVSDTCEVTVDAASSCLDDNYYFMIFRSDGPPIFNRRFLPDVTRSPFNPAGLQCVETDDGSFQWTYYGGVLNDVFFALQSDDEMCLCGSFPNSSQLVSGVCDLVDIQCPEPTNLAYISSANNDYDLVLPRLSENIVESLECVAKRWYYNGILLTNPKVVCRDAVSIVDGSSDVFGTVCGCPQIQHITANNKLAQVYVTPFASRFPGYSPQSGALSYSTTCRPTLACSGANRPIVFSRNYEPILYSGQSLLCQLPPSAVNSTLSSKFWYIDGVMLSEPAFGCVAVYENI